jgi:hypothetical protein
MAQDGSLRRYTLDIPQQSGSKPDAVEVILIAVSCDAVSICGGIEAPSLLVYGPLSDVFEVLGIDNGVEWRLLVQFELGSGRWWRTLPFVCDGAFVDDAFKLGRFKARADQRGRVDGIV